MPRLVLLADLSVLTLGLRLIVSLGIVLGAIAALTWAARRRNGFGFGLGGAQSAITVRSREALTRNGTVALLEVGERALLIGITEQRIEVLAEGADLLPPEQVETPDDRTSSAGGYTSSIVDPGGSTPPGTSFMEILRERSVRRS